MVGLPGCKVSIGDLYWNVQAYVTPRIPRHIQTYILFRYGINVGKYTSPVDPIWLEKLEVSRFYNCFFGPDLYTTLHESNNSL